MSSSTYDAQEVPMLAKSSPAALVPLPPPAPRTPPRSGARVVAVLVVLLVVAPVAA